MEFALFNVRAPGLAVATAVHHGHELRSEIATRIAVDEATRLREEDPYTGLLASRFGVSAVVYRSRFEVDLNRPRDDAVYQEPDEAWGLEVWEKPIPDHQVARSLELYDWFYSELALILDGLVSQFGGFVLYDIHSYNHRRSGPDSPDPSKESPTINLGTGSMPEKWRPVAEAFLGAMRNSSLDGETIDARENVRFQGGHLPRWVHENYGNAGCALAIELKKVFIDEWTGELDAELLDQLGDALIGSVEPVLGKHRLT